MPPECGAARLSGLLGERLIPESRLSMRPLLILPSVVHINSCVLGPEPASPGVKIPANFRNDTAPHGPSFGDKSWRKVFPPPFCEI